MKKSSRGKKNAKSKRSSSSKPKRSTRRPAAVMPATLVGTTQEAHPKLVVTHPPTLAEAIAEPVIDVKKEKPVSVRKLARQGD